MFKKLFCKHEYEFVRNIYGDEINECSGYRSVWKCSKCGKYQYRYDLKLDLRTALHKIYEQYYDNKYQNWKKDHEDLLNNIIKDMIKESKNGNCYYHIVIMCRDESDDKYYYEKWFKENKLSCDIKLKEDKKWPLANNYEFTIYWGNK